MLKFLKGLFKPKAEPPDDAVVEELYEAALDASEPRFSPEDGGRYRVEVGSGSLRIDVPGPRLLAWALDPVHRYRDLVLEADFRFRGETGPSAAEKSPSVAEAAGFLVRYADDRDFYLVMVGDTGHLRFDAVFNGSPRAIIPWTETGADCSRGFNLRVIARDTRFAFLVNDRWVAEPEDDAIDLGWSAVAAESCSPAGGTSVECSGIVIESRSEEVESLHARFDSPSFRTPAARRSLAETLLAAGQALPAAVQMEKAAAERESAPEDLFIRAEARLRLGLLEEAEADLDAVIAADPAHERARMEKANVLYLAGRFAELRDWIDSGSCPRRAMALNLLGHARHSLGDFNGAAAAYADALAADPAQPIFALNAARSLDAAKSGETADAYARAASLLLDADQLDDIALVMRRLAELAPGSPALAALEGKLLYREGRLEEASAAFDALIASGGADASVHYLAALARVGEGRRTEAIPLLRKAVELEGGYAPYRLRLAECLFLAGMPYREELDAALAAFPADGWILNLAAQAALEEGRRDEAASLIERALAALPGELEPAITRSELLSAAKDGKPAPEAVEAALAILAPWSGSARARNQAGNVLSRAGRLEEALDAYGDSLALDPADPDVLENRAACLIELERWSDAEADLRRAAEIRPGGRAYVLMGRIAEAYGEYSRAEVAFRAALDENPADDRLKESLVRVYLSSLRFPKAEPLIAELEASGSPRAERLRALFVDLTHDRISCASCGRPWLSPRNAPPVGALRLQGELPDEAPAGACPSCGKVYCVGCRKDDLENDRLVCPDCRTPLRLSDEGLKRLAMTISGLI